MAWKLKKGDEVYVISGDDRGSKGKITHIDRKNSLVKVEGVSIVSCHIKPSMKNPEGGIVKKESFIHVSNVALVHEKSSDSKIWSKKMTTKVGFKFVDNIKIRYAKRDNSNIGEVSISDSKILQHH